MKTQTPCGLVLVNTAGRVERVTWTENSGPLKGTETLRISRCRESDGSGQFFMGYAHNHDSQSGLTLTGRTLPEVLTHLGEGMDTTMIALFETESPTTGTLKALGLNDYEIKQASS